MAYLRDTATIPDPSVPGGDSTLAGVQKVSTAVDDLHTYLNETDAKIAPASETVSGIVELATTTEAADGTDTERAVTPAGVEAHFDGKATAFAQTLLDDADAATARGTLGLLDVLEGADIGVTVQPYDADTVVATGGVLPVLDGSQLTSIDADATVYDNTTSGLAATDVQAAIDEVAAGGGGVAPVQQKFIVNTTKAATSSASYVTAGISFSLDNDLESTLNKVRIRVYGVGGADRSTVRQEIDIYDGSVYLSGSDTCLTGISCGDSSTTGTNRALESWTMVAEDSPGTVTPKTYTVHHRNPISGSVTIGRNWNNDATAPTVIIIEEIAA